MTALVVLVTGALTGIGRATAKERSRLRSGELQYASW